MLLGMPVLSLTIWVPIAFGIAVLVIGNDRNPGATRWTALAGVATAWYYFIKAPEKAAGVRKAFGPIVTLLDHKYYLDDLNDWFFAGGARKLGSGLWTWGDKTIIDGIMVNGTARAIGMFAGAARNMQTGYIYTYAFTMILGVFAFLTFFLFYMGKI